jgi:hypothetical protein
VENQRLVAMTILTNTNEKNNHGSTIELWLHFDFSIDGKSQQSY